MILPHFGNIFWNGPRVSSSGRTLDCRVRRMMGELRARMQSQRQKHAIAWDRLEDGTEIVASIQAYGSVPVFRVDVVAAIAGPFGTIPASGLFEGRTSDPIGDGYFSDVDFVRWGGTAYYRTGWVTSPEVLNSLMTDDFTLSPCTGQPGSYQGPEQAYANRWTGKMAQLVQVLFGLGIKVPYTHCASRTHWIWVGSNGSWWVIEADTTNGVTAWQLDTTIGSTFSKGLLFTPVPTATLPDVGDRIALASASDLATYAGHTFPWAMTGWAASDSGSLATNVSFEFDSGNNRWNAHRWIITVSGGISPSSSSVVSDLSGVYIGTNIKAPHIYGSSGEWLKSFSYPLPGLVPPTETTKTPIYSWYEEEELITVFHNWEPITNKAVNEKPGDSTFGCSLRSGFGVPVTSSGSYRKGNAAYGRFQWISIEGGNYSGFAPQPEEESITISPSIVSWQWVQLGNYVWATPNSIRSEHWRLNETLETFSYDSAGRWQNVIIPLHNRKAIYLVDAEPPRDASTKNTKIWRSAYADGENWVDYGYSAAYHTSYQTNPCECGESYPPDYIGRWADNTQTPTSPGRIIISNTEGQPLQSPKEDPNKPGYDVFCYEQGRTECLPKDDCKYYDPYSVGTCMTRLVSNTTETILDATNGHFKIKYLENGIERDVYSGVWDIDLFNAWFLETFAAADGLQRLLSTTDVFTGAGWISSDIQDPFDPTKLFVIKNADTYYRMGELNLIVQGFFGYPFPELM